MAEPLRNEVKITLAGQERTLRATFEAIRGMERDLGQGIVKIIGRASQGDMAVSDTAVIIYHGLKGYGDTRLTIDEIGDALMADGFDSLAIQVLSFLMQTLKGASVGKPKEEVAK